MIHEVPKRKTCIHVKYRQTPALRANSGAAILDHPGNFGPRRHYERRLTTNGDANAAAAVGHAVEKGVIGAEIEREAAGCRIEGRWEIPRRCAGPQIHRRGR